MIVCFYYGLEFFPDLIDLWECGGSICINHKYPIALGNRHACSHSTSFSSVFWVLNYNYVSIQLLSLSQSNLCGIIFGAIIGDDNFVVGIDFVEVLYSIIEHDGESKLLIVAGDNQWELYFFGIFWEVIFSGKFLACKSCYWYGFVLTIVEVLFPVFIGLN